MNRYPPGFDPRLLKPAKSVVFGPKGSQAAEPNPLKEVLERVSKLFDKALNGPRETDPALLQLLSNMRQKAEKEPGPIRSDPWVNVQVGSGGILTFSRPAIPEIRHVLTTCLVSSTDTDTTAVQNGSLIVTLDNGNEVFRDRSQYGGLLPAGKMGFILDADGLTFPRNAGFTVTTAFTLSNFDSHFMTVRGYSEVDPE